MTDHARNTTARQAYDQHRRDIDRLLGMIKAELRNHRSRAQREPRDSGYTGDLGHVQSQLVEVLAFLTNSEPEQIDKQLGEGR